MVDGADGVTRDQLWAWLRGERIPQVLAGSPVAMCLAFAPMPLPEDKMSYVEDVPGLERRITLLWLTEVEPQECWESTFAGAGEAIAASGLGRLELTAPFVPTIPGTDRYVDDLR